MSAPKAEDRPAEAICTATKANGHRCVAYRLSGSTTCRLHGPKGSEQAQALGRAGFAVAQAHREAEAARVRLETAEDIQALLEQTATDLVARAITPAMAAAANALCRTAVQALDLKVTEQATREIAKANARSQGVRRR